MSAPDVDWRDGVFADSFEFNYPPTAHVACGAGVLEAQATAQVRRWGVSHVVVATSRSLAGTPEIDALVRALSAAGVSTSVFSAAMRHCPIDVALELAARVRASGAGGIIAVGGSSVSDAAKAANLIETFLPGVREATVPMLAAAIDVALPLRLRLLGVPTTLSGGEFTPVVGISDPVSGHKAVLRHPRLCADAIVLDARLQRHTPDSLWASTGFKLVDHAVERILARNHRPLIDAQCVCGLQWLLPLLPRSIGGGMDAQDARARLLQVLWVIQSSHGSVGTGLSHALAHQLGAACGLDHGWGSAVCLTPTIRLLRDSGRLRPERVAVLAQAFQVRPGAGSVDAIVAALESLRGELGLPGTLRDAGVSHIEPRDVATAVLADPTTRSSPGEPFTADEVQSLLEAAGATSLRASA